MMLGRRAGVAAVAALTAAAVAWMCRPEAAPWAPVASPVSRVAASAPPSSHDAYAADRPARPHDQAPALAAASPGSDARDPVSRAQAQRAQDAWATEREAAFRGERMDAGWASNAASALQQAFDADAAPAAVELRSLECRSQSCRLELADDGSAPLEALLARLTQRMAGSQLSAISTGTVTHDGSGSIVVLYLSR